MVRLEQFEGKRRGRNGIIETKILPIDNVFRDDVRVAFCARFSGAPVCFRIPMSEAERDDIRQAIAALRIEDGEFGPPSEKTRPAPPLVPLSTDEEDEESEIWTPEDDYPES